MPGQGVETKQVVPPKGVAKHHFQEVKPHVQTQQGKEGIKPSNEPIIHQAPQVKSAGKKGKAGMQAEQKQQQQHSPPIVHSKEIVHQGQQEMPKIHKSPKQEEGQPAHRLVHHYQQPTVHPETKDQKSAMPQKHEYAQHVKPAQPVQNKQPSKGSANK